MNHHWQDISKFIVFEKDHEKIRSRLYKVYKAYLDIRKVETNLKVAEAWEFWYIEKDYNCQILRWCTLTILFLFLFSWFWGLRISIIPLSHCCKPSHNMTRCYKSVTCHSHTITCYIEECRRFWKDDIIQHV